MAIILARSAPRLSDAVYNSVREKIVRTTMPPGSRITEANIGKCLGVSRTPVREALLRLADEGLVQMVPQSGIYVAPVNFVAVNEAQFIREHLECAVIREVAVKIDGGGMALLRGTLSLQEAARDAEDIVRFYELDELLHRQLCELGGRSGVWRVIQHSKHQLDRVRWLSLPVAEHIPHLIIQHQAVVDALGQRDPDIAEASLRGHLREVYATIERLKLDQTGDALPKR
jgi:GntR family transcriptional regulator, rspAB operon transcriptional repressor